MFSLPWRQKDIAKKIGIQDVTVKIDWLKQFIPINNSLLHRAMELVIDGASYNLKEHLHLEYYETSGTLEYVNGVIIVGLNKIYKEARKFRLVVIEKQECLLSDHGFEEFKKNGLGKK